MIFPVHGILDDGSGQADPTFPRDLRRAITVGAGEDFTVRVRLTNRAGVPVALDLTSGTPDVLRFSARSGPAPGRVQFTQNAVRAAGFRAGTYDVVVAGEKTRWTDLRRMIWDLWLLRPSNGPTYEIIPASGLIIRRVAIEPPGNPPGVTP